MAKLEPKWANDEFVSVLPKTENSGNFNVEQGRVHLIADGQGIVSASLPSASNGLNVFIKAMVSDILANPVNVVPQGVAKIDAVAGTYSMTAEKQTLHLVSDGTDWYIL